MDHQEDDHHWKQKFVDQCKADEAATLRKITSPAENRMRTRVAIERLSGGGDDVPDADDASVLQ